MSAGLILRTFLCLYEISGPVQDQLRGTVKRKAFAPALVSGKAASQMACSRSIRAPPFGKFDYFLISFFFIALWSSATHAVSANSTSSKRTTGHTTLSSF